MGGAIGVESEPGRGSTFCFTVAVKDGVEASAPFETISPLRSRHVLVVHDQVITRTALVKQLRAWDVVVDEAGDGAEALDRLQAAVRSGVPLAGAMAADPTLAGTPLVMLSPRARTGIGAAPAVGIAACLTRPVWPTRLREALMGALGEDNVPLAALAQTHSAESAAAGAPRSLRMAAALADRLEQLGREGRFGGAPGLLAALESEIEQVLLAAAEARRDPGIPPVDESQKEPGRNR